MVYVDMVQPAPRSCRWRWRIYSHMWADDPFDLQIMAKVLGLRQSWLHDKPGFPHYDVTPRKRNMAILWGAQVTTVRDYLRQRRQQNASVI